MKVIKNNSLVEMSDSQGDLVAFVMKISHEYKSFENDDILIDISNLKNISSKDLSVFLPLIKQHSKNKRSFVIVGKEIDFNKVSDKINIVPTRQEALDLIEIENIERDLGF